MLKYIKWICLSISIIGICILSYIFIKNNTKNEILEKDTFEIVNIQNIAWYITKMETYENNKLKSQINLINPEHITFLENQVQYTNPKTNQINTYIYDYKDKLLTIYGAKRYLLEGTYNIKLENKELILTKKEKNTLNIYYFTKAAG